MKKFSDFGIDTMPVTAIVGDKIKIDRVLNRPIKIHAIVFAPSDFGGERMDMQIELNGEKRLLRTSSQNLMYQGKKVPKDGFPFDTTIVLLGEKSYEFS